MKPVCNEAANSSKAFSSIGFKVLQTSSIVTKAAEIGKVSTTVVEDLQFACSVKLQVKSRVL